MKKIISVFLILLLIVSVFCSCSAKTKAPMTEQHEKYGRKALEIADAYLDFDLTLEEAYKKIDALRDAEDSLPDGTEEEKVGNLSVEVRVMSLESAFFHAQLRSSGLTGIASKESADILTARNELAEFLGVKAR